MMTSSPWRLAAAVAVASSLSATSASSAHADDALERMRRRQSTLRTLSAQVEQTKSFPQLGIDDPTEHGFLYLERGSGSGSRGDTRLRFEIEAPERRVLIVADGSYVLYQPRIKQAVEGEVTKHARGSGTHIFTGLLTGSAEAAEALERDYVAEEVVVNHLRFDAREGVAAHCRRFELWIDETTGLPRRQSCEEANGSVITLTLRDLVLDAALPENAFELDLPRDVERIKG